jgi:hypothetical protein
MAERGQAREANDQIQAQRQDDVDTADDQDVK